MISLIVVSVSDVDVLYFVEAGVDAMTVHDTIVTALVNALSTLPDSEVAVAPDAEVAAGSLLTPATTLGGIVIFFWLQNDRSS